MTSLVSFTSQDMQVVRRLDGLETYPPVNLIYFEEKTQTNSKINTQTFEVMAQKIN